MEENAQGAVELNAVQGVEKEKEEAIQELYDVQKELEYFGLPEGFEPVTISKYKEVKLSDRITERDVLAVELKNEEQEKQTLLYKRLEDRRLALIATINEKNEIMLEEEYRKKYEGYIRKEELEKPYVIDKKEMEREKLAQIEPDKEKQESERPKEKTTREVEIANALGISPDQILNVVEIKDEATMSNVLNKNLETKNLYAVKLRQDSGGIGSNDWVIVNQKANGHFEKAMHEDPSDTMQDLGKTLGIKNNIEGSSIRAGDVNAISAPTAGKRNVEVNRYRFQDGSTYVMQLDRDYEADIHVFEEVDGKLIPLCEDEHEDHEQETIELPDRDGEVIEEEDEGRTPWGDAEARTRH